MQALFSMDMNSAFSMEMLAEYSRSFPPNKKVAPYFQRLAEGVLEHKDHIVFLHPTHSWFRARTMPHGRHGAYVLTQGRIRARSQARVGTLS